MTLMEDLDARRERAAQDKENSARLAHSYATFTTTGQGSIQHPKRVAFDTTFTEKPFVQHGCVVDVDALGDALGQDSEDVTLPLVTGYVTEWDQDDRDFYVGCWIGARVAFLPDDLVDVEAQPSIEHHFTFSAIAIKDIPTDYTDATD